MDEMVSTRIVIMEGVTPTRGAALHLDCGVGLANHLKVIVPSTQGGKKLRGGTQSAKMGVSRSLDPKHIGWQVEERADGYSWKGERLWFRALSPS